MGEFTTFDQCAAYVAARTASISLERAAAGWPEALRARARHGAIDTVQLTAQALWHDRATEGRRYCLREAISTALGVAAAVDAAGAMGYAGDDLVELRRIAGRTVALLGMLLHAGSADAL
jgi:hypothetical protein